MHPKETLGEGHDPEGKPELALGQLESSAQQILGQGQTSPHPSFLRLFPLRPDNCLLPSSGTEQIMRRMGMCLLPIRYLLS